MNGMLLAAGRGERMEPLSTWVAKPALEVQGRPLLASALDHLVRAGCAPIAANLHRHPSAVAAAVRVSEATGTVVRFSFEPELLGTAGGIAGARRILARGPVLVANADVQADLDLGPLLAAGTPGGIVLGVLPHPDPRRWGRVIVDGRGGVTDVLPPGPEPAGMHFSGFQWLGSEVVAELPVGPGSILPIWRRLAATGKLRAVELTGTWKEAGSPAAYRDLVVAGLDAGAWVHPSARLGRDVELRRSAVGEGCRVESACRLERTVVTAHAAVGARAVLRACVVAGPVAVEPGRELESCLVLPDGVYPL